MRWHLVKHAFRRTIKLHAFAAFVTAQLWIGAGNLEIRAFLLLLAMATALMLGPMFSLWAFSGKEIFLRPVSHRQLWQATWIVAVVMPALTLGTGKIIGASLGASLFRRGVHWDAIALSTLLDMTYSGFLLTFVPLARYGPRWSSLPRWARRTLDQIWTGACFTIFLGGVVWIILLRHHVPVSWREISPLQLSVMVIAACVAIASLFLPMRPAPRPNTRSERAPAVPAPGAARTASVAAGVGGLRLMAVTEAWILLAFLGCVFLAICVLALVNAPWRELPSQLRMVLVALFDRRSGDGIALGVWPFLALMLSFRHPFLPLLRRLRTLPISTGRLLAFLAGLPIAQATAMWTVLLIANVAITGHWPADLRLELLALIVGLAAGSHALLIRTQAQVASFWMIIFVITLVRIFVKKVQAIDADIFFFSAGLFLFAFATLVNYRSLTMHNEIFRVPLKPAFASPSEAP